VRGAALLFGGGFVALLGLVFGLMLLGGSIGESCQGTGVSAAGEPPLVQYYLGAAQRYQLGPDGYAYLAAINHVETTFGTNMATSSAGAVGWMQFEPATFVTYGVAVTNPGGQPDPYDPQDAIYSAGRYLHASGAPGNWSAAVYAYNHAGWYVAEVQALAARYIGPSGVQKLSIDIQAAWGGKQPPHLPTPTTIPVVYSPGGTGGCCPGATGSAVAAPAAAGAVGCAKLVDDVTPVPGRVAVIMPNGLARPPQQAPASVQAMVAAGDRIDHFDYQWGGGHANPALSDSQTHPQPQGGSLPGDNGSPGYDCSGSTDYVLYGGGFGQTLLGGSDPASGTLESVGDPGPGRWVTIFATAGHAYIEIAGIYLDTAAGLGRPPNPPSTGPRWTPVGTGPAGFAARHPAGL
jgi:Transglycosylase SLT domain